MHVGDQPLYPVDVEKAKALMKEAGFENGFLDECAGSCRQSG
jgi:peptide/nickel transport system substrate-binding protein